MDIDIDVAPSFKLESVFKTAVRASMVASGDRLAPHPCGAYFQTVPVDPLTRLAAIPYKRAAELGALKVDFLNLTALNVFSARSEILELLDVEPDWTLLLIPSVVAKLFQVSQHYELLYQVKPRSVLELADCLALIRPQKKHFLANYLKDPARVRAQLYSRTSADDSYGFKKGHALAYSMIIVLQLHLAKEGLL